MMRELTADAQGRIEDIARRHGVSTDAVRAMLDAVLAGNGHSAQFNIPELGGMGQWMNGGMIMVGDMFNHGLKNTVGSLCSELTGMLSGPPLFIPPAPGYGQSSNSGGGNSGWSKWWPDGLGSPASSGAQNDMRYAWFPTSRRLVIDVGGSVSVYDTGDHQIGGVSQQQSGGQSLTFTSQYGTVRTLDLPLVQGPGSSPQFAEQPAAVPNPAPGGDDVFAAIGRLGQLRDQGLLTEAEFTEKKAELLRRI
jgi:hypothetical protein